MESRQAAEREAQGRINAYEERARKAQEKAVQAEAHANEFESLARQRIAEMEADIDRRVMEGTEQVRLEAAERVDALIDRFGREAEETARQRAEERRREEDERIQREAERRVDLAKQSADEEVQAAAERARQEALSAASSTAPEWERQESAREAGDDSGTTPRRRGGPGAGGYRTF